MHEKNGIVELNDDEARLANHCPQFPLRQLPRAIAHMKRRTHELQSIAEAGWEETGENNCAPLSIYAFRLMGLVDELEELR